MRSLLRFLTAGVLLVATSTRAAAPFELKDGDRVIFLGDTLIEREQHYGWIELMLTTRFPDRNVTFRNLGWSADLPNGESRLGLSLTQAGNEPEGEAWKLLQKQIEETKPTVAFLGYGMAASFAGEAGLPKFKEDYERLLETIEKLSPGCRLVLLGPINHEQLITPQMADPRKHNGQLMLFSDAVASIAKSRNAAFVPLYDKLKPADANDKAELPGAFPLAKFQATENGIHLNAIGYVLAARVIDQTLFGKEFRPPGITTTLLPVILRKNEFYFHRSRPANMAYIFGFRKREQGKNAVEMPQFDPLIAKEEQKIRELCKHLNNANFKPGPELQPAALLGKAAAAKHTPQPTPEFTVADGLEVTLWAENPHLAKPIQINFDPQGRLWVASSEVYPQVEPGEAAHDKIIVLEDTKGAGKADKATVFAEGLLIPTGVIPGDGGCYVAQSTELLHFKQTDPNKFVGDQKRVVLSSFGTEDTHHNLHTLRWGPDGRLWMNQSIYTRSEIETPHGVVRLRSGGVFRFEPASQKLEVVFKGWVNSWGHQFDEFGQSLLTDGAGFQGINWGLPGAMYFTYAKARRTLQSISPGNYPKFASLEIIRSTHFPADWQGRVVTCDFRANRVTSFSITEQGAAYITKQEADICRTSNNTFRPIDVKLGPDGALYIADWSNPIINHGEVDFRDPRRDREHGRIWRVAAKGRSLVPKINAPDVSVVNKALDEAKRAGQRPVAVELLVNAWLGFAASSNSFTSAQAIQVLKELGKDTVAKTLQTVTEIQLENIRNPRGPAKTLGFDEDTKLPAKMNAPRATTERDLLSLFWVHQALGIPNAELLNQLLAAQDGRIRAAAVRALSFATTMPAKPVLIADANGTASTYLADAGASFTESDTVTRLAKLVADPHPRVRVEAVRALAKFPSAKSAELVLSAVNGIGADPFLDYAVWLSINELAQPFLAALESGAWSPDSPAKQTQLEYAMKSLDPALAASSVAKLLAAKPLTKDGTGPWIELIGAAGGQPEINRLWEQVAKRDFTDAALVRAMNALASAARLRNVKPAGDGARATAFFYYATFPQRVAALDLMGAWKNPGAAFAEMVKLAGDERTPPEVRTAAFAAFRELGAIGPVLGALQPMAAKTSPAPVRRAAAVTLASLQPAKFADLALDELAETKTDAEALDLWRAVLATKGAAKSFGEKVGSRTGLPPHVASSGLRAAREGAQPDATLVASLTKLANITALSPDKLTPAKLKELADLALKAGDPARGELVYRRAELGCVLCHSIGGVGGKVGPDMTSLGAAAPADYLVESVLLPNAKIKEGFHGINVETKDDLEYSGILVRETGQEVVLRNAQNQEVSVAKSNIRKRANASQSLMPTGLLDTVNEGDRNDLVAFLSRLGKPGDYDASKGGVARVWRVLPVTHRMDQGGWDKITKGDFTAKWTAMESGIGEHTWKPATSLVSGALAKPDFAPGSAPVHVTFTSVFVATTFVTTKPGLVDLHIEGLTEAEVWLDGNSVEALRKMFPAITYTQHFAKPRVFTLHTQLPAGTHTVVLRLDGAKLPDSVRLKSTDVSWSLN